MERKCKNSSLKAPDAADLYGASIALVCLQKTYHLKTKRLAMGERDGIKYWLLCNLFKDLKYLNISLEIPLHFMTVL